MQPVQDLTVEDRVSRTQFQYSLEDADTRELATWVPRFMHKPEPLPMLRDVANDQQDPGLQTRLVIDRATPYLLGISPQTLDNTLYDAFGQRQVSTILTQLNQDHVVLETQPDFKNDPQDLNHLFVQSNTGGAVPLSTFTHPESANAPLTVNHQGQFPVVTVSFNLAPGASLGDAVAGVNEAKQARGMPAG